MSVRTDRSERTAGFCGDTVSRTRLPPLPSLTILNILAGDGFRCTTQVRPGERCPETKLLEVHHIYGEDSDVLLVPDGELRTVCRKHNPRGG